MSLPLPSRTSPGPRRRTLLASAAGSLAAVGAVGVSGCSRRPADADSGSAGSPSVADRTRARAARDSLGLLGRYDAVIAAHPQLAARLRPLRAEVARQVTAFGGDAAKATATVSPSASAVGASSAPTGTADSASTAPESTGGSGSAPPESAKDALSGLTAAEKELSARRTDALTEVPGELARLLASVAAAGAVHVFLLTEGGR
ncbi:hypothetical protein [Streptomyces sp. YIM S03343]